jgi:cellobiose phosphorylase
MRIMIELYSRCGKNEHAEILMKRAEEIKETVNRVGWDGEWYVYGFTGSGKPIGSKLTREARFISMPGPGRFCPGLPTGSVRRAQ